MAPFRDTVLKPSALAKFAHGNSGFDHYWGGTVTAADGTTMTIYTSDWYRQSGNSATWANWTCIEVLEE